MKLSVVLLDCSALCVRPAGFGDRVGARMTAVSSFAVGELDRPSVPDLPQVGPAVPGERPSPLPGTDPRAIRRPRWVAVFAADLEPGQLLRVGDGSRLIATVVCSAGRVSIGYRHLGYPSTLHVGAETIQEVRT